MVNKSRLVERIADLAENLSELEGINRLSG